jgi:hypothetical protein
MLSVFYINFWKLSLLFFLDSRGEGAGDPGPKGDKGDKGDKGEPAPMPVGPISKT